MGDPASNSGAANAASSDGDNIKGWSQHKPMQPRTQTPPTRAAAMEINGEKSSTSQFGTRPIATAAQAGLMSHLPYHSPNRPQHYQAPPMMSQPLHAGGGGMVPPYGYPYHPSASAYLQPGHPYSHVPAYSYLAAPPTAQYNPPNAVTSPHSAASIRSGKHFESRPSSAPVRFPDNHKKTKASRIPDDSEDSGSSTSTKNATATMVSANSKPRVRRQTDSVKPAPKSPQQEESCDRSKTQDSVGRISSKTPQEVPQHAHSVKPQQATSRISSKAQAPQHVEPVKAAVEAQKAQSAKAASQPRRSKPPPKAKSKIRPRRANPGKRKIEDASNYVRPSRVDYVLEWKPEGKDWKESFYDYKRQEEIEADSDDERLFEDPSTIPIKNKRHKRESRSSKRRQARKKKEDEEEEDERNGPFICDVYYDSRYLEYDNNPRGWVDRLLPTSIVKDADARPCDTQTFLKRIPDDPVLPSTSSRLGYRYQARVAKFGEYSDGKFDVDYLPEQDTVWDPHRADAAERRGEDIDGFLRGNHELVKKQFLMELLHACDYIVETARTEYQRVINFTGEPTSGMDIEEACKFERLLKTKKKDFNKLATSMRRSPTDCMIYYYRWKRSRSSSQYQSMKTEWKNEWCAICDDGGDMIICDNCDRSYHLECLGLSAADIPEGDWFCPRCRAPSPEQDGGRPRRRNTDYQPRQSFSPFYHAHSPHKPHPTLASPSTGAGPSSSQVDGNEVTAVETVGKEGQKETHWAFQKDNITSASLPVEGENEVTVDDVKQEGQKESEIHWAFQKNTGTVSLPIEIDQEYTSEARGRTVQKSDLSSSSPSPIEVDKEAYIETVAVKKRDEASLPKSGAVRTVSLPTEADKETTVEDMAVIRDEPTSHKTDTTASSSVIIDKKDYAVNRDETTLRKSDTPAALSLPGEEIDKKVAAVGNVADSKNEDVFQKNDSPPNPLDNNRKNPAPTSVPVEVVDKEIAAGGNVAASQGESALQNSDPIPNPLENNLNGRTLDFSN